MAGPVTLPEWLSGCGENFRQRALNPMSMSFEVHIIAHHIVIVYIYIHIRVITIFIFYIVFIIIVYCMLVYSCYISYRMP